MHIQFLKKKNVILGSLLALLVIASVVNYNLYSDDLSPVSENDNPLNAKLVNSLTEEEIMNGDVSVSGSFFIDYRLEREASRAENIETLKGITSSEVSSDESINEANEVMIQLVRLSENEMQLENMILAKGYEDCVVFLHDEYVNVLVKTDTLSASQAVQIQDIISKQCDVPLSKIYIAATGKTE